MRRWEREVVGGRGLVRAVWQWRRGPVADGLGFVGRDWFEGDFFFLRNGLKEIVGANQLCVSKFPH